ncbi:uncharacterized protein LOC112341534 [Selaginella moellendorffii]|uniref:uncharacterized protein LOC112341534 n=1 Tax=Selaginella moellendorffii TaxID=88036 RepID=UPI000D1C4C63|nr:uncharacterized protein LOC112341534 [Selaginella moellendorffii]|eukprot:XP_024517563.1 uncharacterized protein LOC112341534 [Selaginella moellendorffii]
MSWLLASRHLHCCALVSKRWKDLARRVTHFCLDLLCPATEEKFIHWFHPDHGSNLHFLEIKRLLCDADNISSTHWLQVIGRTLHSLAIHGIPKQTFEGFWSSISACQQLRCLHIHASISTKLPTSAPPLLPNLLYCTVARCRASGVSRLLEHCPSLVFLRVRTVVATRPRTYLLKSHSLDCLQISTCGGSAAAIFSLAIDMPKLRWLLVSAVPCVELQSATCNVEWVLLDGGVRHRGLCHSSRKLKSLTISPSFRSPENVMQRLAPFPSRVEGIKELSLSLLVTSANEFHPRCINLAVFLERFQGLEVLRVAHRTIKVLGLEYWRWRHTPLVVHIESIYASSGVTWESDEIDFLWKLMRTNDCVTMLELEGFVFKGEPAGFRPQLPAAFGELLQAFPGRVKLHPVRFGLAKKCDMLWRSWETRVRSEAPYKITEHWCKEMHLHDTPCAWDWQ